MFHYIFGFFVISFYLIFAFITFPIYMFSRKKYGSFIVRSCLASILKVCGVKYETEGLENVDPHETYIVISNHLSVFDIPVIGAMLPLNLRIFAKKELFSIPVFGQMLWLYDFVFVDRKHQRSAVKSVRTVAEKMKFCSFLIFPEGTRSRTGEVGRFKSGALSLAAGHKILPVVLFGTEKIMAPGNLTVHSGTVRVKILPPTELGENETRQELAERLQEMVSDCVESDKK